MPRTISLLFLFSLGIVGCTGPNPDLRAEEDLASATADFGAPKNHAAIACHDFAGALCTQLSSCSPYLLRFLYGDDPTCIARVQLSCLPLLKLSGSTWTLARLRACTTAYKTQTCDDYFDPDGPLACRPQPGDLPDGAVCADGNQCHSAFCNLSANNCGTCLTPAQNGEACSSNFPCALGLSCASGKCAPLGGPGAACGQGQTPCRSGYYCHKVRCARVLSEGKTCDRGGCDGNQGLFCNSANKCQAYKLADPGESCSPMAGTIVRCAASGTCEGAGSNRQCRATEPDGAACGPQAGGSACLPPAQCPHGVCSIFDPTACK